VEGHSGGSNYFGAKRRKKFFGASHFLVVPTQFLMELGAQPSKLNNSNCHVYKVTSPYLCLLNDCLGPNLQVYQTLHICYLCPPVPTTNQKWGGTCPSVPHGVGAYAWLLGIARRTTICCRTDAGDYSHSGGPLYVERRTCFLLPGHLLPQKTTTTIADKSRI